MKRSKKSLIHILIAAALLLLNFFTGIKLVTADETEDKLLIADDCADFSRISKSMSTMSIIRTENCNINRNYATETAQGPKGINDKAPKYLPAEIVYKTYADIKRFEVSALIYLYEKGYRLYDDYPALENVASYRLEIHVSRNGNDWSVVPVNLQAYDPGDEVAYPSRDFCGIIFTNSADIPAGMRFLKIILVGQVAVINFMGEEQVLDGSDGYANISSNPDYTFNDIYRYWNSWAPILENVNIYADKHAELETAVATLSVNSSSKSLRKGEIYKIIADYTLSTDATKRRVTDFSELNVVLKSGGEYVNLDAASGTITVKDDFSEQNASFSFQLEKDGAASDVYSVSLIMPVESVTLITEKRSARVGSGFVPIGVEIYPFTATNITPEWIVTDANGNVMENYVSITADGMLKPLQEGSLKICAVVDGVRSNVLDFTIEAKAMIVIENDLKLNVGDTINLSARITPSSAAGFPITWAVIGDDGVVSITDNKLTVNKIGVFAVRASIEGASAEIYGEAWKTETKIVKKGCRSAIGNSDIFAMVLITSLFLIKKTRGVL